MAEPQAGRVEPSPPRAFTQGVGTVFQFAGVILFLASMFVCCSSSLLSKETATRDDLTRIGWHLPSDATESPSFSAQRAITVAVVCAVFFGMATAGMGLGLQAQNRNTPMAAIVLMTVGSIFWIVQMIFAMDVMRSVLFAAICGSLGVLFLIAMGMSIVAWREMRNSPPPTGYEILPADYKIPYSHYHADPPEVRLAAEIEQRRQRLAVQKKELEMLEEKIKKILQE
jgi:hypothetical protein